jgi:hypothetical protein
MTTHKKHPTYESFLHDVENHSLEIIRDDELYRHLVFSNQGSFNMKFSLITWPGYLVICGDMGDYMFSRLSDMFIFFRNDKQEINPGYWGEKVKSESRFGDGVERFSVDLFRQNVLNSVRSSLDLEEEDQIPEEIQTEISELLNAEDEWECVEVIRRFDSEKIQFNDFWEFDHKDFTYHYIWCCYAIVWGINQYDNFKKGKI